MAIKATFLADFTSFQKAVTASTADLKNFETTTDKVDKSLKKLGSEFSGDKIKKEAALVEEAVLRIGGASKLTAEEQAKVNKVIEEAIAKYKALGQEAPKALQMMADETKKVTQATEPAATAVQGFSATFKGVLAGMVSATAIIGGVKTAFSAVTAFIGGSIESFAAAEAAQKKLTAALTAAGRATPDVLQQFDRLAAQFQKTTVYSDDLVTEMQALLVQVGNVMPQQMEGALKAATDLASGLGVDLRTATMLVGKAFEGETGTLKRYGIVIDEAKLKAEGMPAVLAAIQEKFGGQAQAEAEGYAGQIKQIENAWDNLKEAVGKKIVTDPVFIAALRELKNATEEGATAATENKIAWGLFINLLPQWTKDLVAFHGELKKGADEANRFAKQVADIKAKPIPTVRTEAQLPTPFATPEEIKAIEGTEKAAKANTAYAESLKQIRAQLSGAALQSEVTKLQQAFAGLPPTVKETAVTLENTGKAAKALYDRGATLTPELFRILLATERITPEAKALGNELKDLGDSFKFAYDLSAKLPTAMEGIGSSIGHVFAVKLPPLVEDAIKRSERLKGSWSDLSKALSELATIAGGTFGKMVSALGSMIAAANTAKLSLAAIKDGMNAKSMLESLTSVTSGVLGLVTVAIQAGQALAKIFDRNKGRDMVEAFAETMGGFEALHAQLLTLGDVVGEELWKKLTQGVGRNNPEQAAKVIAEIEAALAAVQQQTEANTVTTEEQAQAQIETATEAAKALEELGAKLTINADEWGAWSDRVTRYLDDLARNIRAMPVPAAGGGGGTAEPGFASGTHGQFVDFGAGTSVRLHGKERISTPGEEAPHITRIYIDGRKVAEASARYIPEVMEGRF